jgi:low temperature requirement protein LtrA
MPIITILITLVIVGLVLWLVEQIPMDATIARIIRVVVIVLVVLWLISLFVPQFGHFQLR